jgi:hypothetical protein
VKHEDNALVRVRPLISGSHSKRTGHFIRNHWSSGDVSVVTLALSGEVFSSLIRANSTTMDSDEMDVDNDDHDEKELKQFYADGSITAVDMFEAPISEPHEDSPIPFCCWSCVVVAVVVFSCAFVVVATVAIS